MPATPSPGQISEVTLDTTQAPSRRTTRAFLASGHSATEHDSRFRTFVKRTTPQSYSSPRSWRSHPRLVSRWAAVVAVAGASRAAAQVVHLRRDCGIVFHGWHIPPGDVVGPSAVALLAAAGVPLLLAFVALGRLGIVVWLVRWRGSARAWTEAAWPACIASAVAFPESIW